MRLSSYEMEVYEQMEGAYFSGEVANAPVVTDLKIEWLEEEEYAFV